MRRRDFLRVIPIGISTHWLCGCSGVGNLLSDSIDDGLITFGNLRVETLTSGLDTPWDIAWGPDDVIWVTERRGQFIASIPPGDMRRKLGLLG